MIARCPATHARLAAYRLAAFGESTVHTRRTGFGFHALVALILLIAPAIVRADDAAKVAETIVAVEFHHAEFDHYFLSTDPVEINALDTHFFVGWERTGRQFNVYPLGTTATSPTCRFFSTSFGIKSSHFYTADDVECEGVKLNPDWQFEGLRFNVVLPSAGGSCIAGTVPLYRVYNDGHGGAPNHRFVTSVADRQAMLALGYLDEGVAMCVAPPTVVAGTAEGKWRGSTAEHNTVDLWVLADGTFYAVYTQPNSPLDSGVVVGTSVSAAGTFDSVNATETPFRHDPAFTAVLAPVLQAAHGTYVPRQSMQLTLGGRAVTFVYDAAYDQPASLAQIQGEYSGNAGHFADPHEGAIATLDAIGNYSMTSSECLAAGALKPHGTVNVFDASVVGIANNCAIGVPTLTPGFAFYDAMTRLLRVLVNFPNGSDILFFVGGH